MICSLTLIFCCKSLNRTILIPTPVYLGGILNVLLKIGYILKFLESLFLMNLVEYFDEYCQRSMQSKKNMTKYTEVVSFVEIAIL